MRKIACRLKTVEETFPASYAIFSFLAEQDPLNQTAPNPHTPAKSLVATGLCLSFGGFQVLKEVDFELLPGRIHAITGENGAGKSSLGKVLAGLYRPDSGALSIGDQPISPSSVRDGLRQGIALIHQEPLTFPDLSITENILAGNLPAGRIGVNWGRAHAKSQELLVRLGSKLDVKRTAGTLSIADQQILELAAALAHEARFFIFDETSAPLTPPEAQALFKIMRELRDQGCGIGFVSHHLDEVFEIADEITVLREGQKVAHLQITETSQAEIVRHMVGRAVEQSKRTARALSAEVALSVEHLSGPGFDDVSFTVNAGEIFGIGGLVGAGRTELARALYGISRVSSGQVKLLGQTYKPKNPQEAIQSGVNLVPEDRRGAGLMLERSIKENASLQRVKDFANRFGVVSTQLQDEQVVPLLDSLKTVLRSVEQPVGQLSGGNQQKVVLAKSLLRAPRLLILDEPTRGVDIGAKFDVHALIRELADSGVTILLISSDLPEVLALSDRIGVMRRGNLVATLTASEATREKVISLASGGSA